MYRLSSGLLSKKYALDMAKIFIQKQRKGIQDADLANIITYEFFLLVVEYMPL